MKKIGIGYENYKEFIDGDMYIKSIAVNGMKFPQPYWANTSSNQIIKDMVWHADDDMREELDALIRGGAIEKTE